MRRAAPYLALVALALPLASCGGEQVVSPAPETVVGSTPTGQTTGTQGTTATTATTGGGTTTATTTGKPGGGAADGKSVFASNGCGSCHTYAPAGTKGTIGPDLDKLAQYAKQAKKPLAAFAQESIVDPGAYLQPGFQNIMPKDYGKTISGPELDALVKFLTAG